MSVVDRHLLNVTLGSVPLEYISARVTVDESWAPYGQATIECALPDDLDTLDPREGLRAEMRAEQHFGSGPTNQDYTDLLGGSIAAWTAAYGGSIPAINAANFRPFNVFGLRDSDIRSLSMSLRRRSIDWRARRVTLELATDEALLQAYALVATAPYEPSSTSVRAVVTYALALIGATLQVGTADGEFDAGSGQWLPGVTAWDYLAPLVQAAGLRLYCDEQRRWYLVTDDTIAEGQLQLVDTLNLTSDEDTIDLDGEWYDAVVITYKWVDDLGATQMAWDTAAEENFSKVFSLVYELPYPGPGAAARVLSRALGRGRVQEVRAVSKYTATPSQRVSINVEGDDVQVGFVAAISWEFPGAEMSVKSRGLVETPPTAWIFDPEGLSWASVPVGVDWTEDI